MGELIRHKYLERLDSFRDRPDLIKIMTGVRRSGKSTILSQFRRKLESERQDVVYLDMETMSFSITSDREMYYYITELMPSKNTYVLLDEVQFVKGWEKVVNNIRANGANVYVTGSNAGVLSSDFTTILGGRYVEIHILPLSFNEFLERYPPKGSDRTEKRFNQYVKEGGLPVLDWDKEDATKRQILLEGVCDSVVYKDIGARSDMNLRTVRRLTEFLYSNIHDFRTLFEV